MKSKVLRGVLGFLIAFGVFSAVGYTILYKQFLYPAQHVIDWKTTRYHAVSESVKSFKEMGYKKQVNLKEFNKDKEEALSFLSKVSSLIELEVPQVEAVNKYGQVYVKPDGSKVMINSVLGNGSVVKLTVPDYTKINPSKEEIKKLMDFTSEDEMYGVKLEGIFLKYLNSLESIPTKVEEFVPEYQLTEIGYALSEKSVDVLIGYFYETEEFKDLMKRFAEISIYGDTNPDLKYWQSKYKSAKEIKPEDKISSKTVRVEWLYWNSLKDKGDTQEPVKNLTYFYMNPNFLINTSGESGNGSFDFKASFGVPVRTYVENSKGNKLPVELKLLESYTGEDAIRFLEKMDTRNRGLQASSKLQFYVLKYELVNLSTNGVVSTGGLEGFAMSDKQGNLSARTGRMFGLEELSSEGFVVRPGERKELVFWTAIPDLDTKELAWGTSFKDKNDIVWFNKSGGKE